MMYPNLKAEMAKRNLTVTALSEKTKIPYSTLAPKLRGAKPISYDDAKRIQTAVETKLSLDVLFSEVAED